MLDRVLGGVQRQFTSLGTRLMRLYLLMLLIPVIGIGLYGSVYIRQALSDTTIASGLDEVRFRAMTLDTLLGQIHNDILYLGQRVDGDLTGPDPSDELNGFAASHPTYQTIVWVDEAGHALGGFLSNGLGQWTQTDAFQDVLRLTPNSIRFIPMVLADQPDSARMIVAARLQESVLMFEVHTAYLLNSLTGTALDSEWALRMRANTFLTTAEDPSVFIDDGGQFAGSSGYLRFGDRMNLYYHTGPGGSWTLIHSLPTSSLSADLTDYYTTFGLLLVGALISVAGLALFAIARIIDPVYQLEDMVDQLRQGNARPHLPEPLPSDEFGKLMQAFDQMAAEIEEKRRTERKLMEQIIQAQEDERKIIAYDLHDGLIQQLVGARFYIGQFRSGGFAEDKRDSVIKGYDLLTDSIADGRRIIQGLHPTVLEDLGLAEALRELVKDMAITAGWEVDCRIADLTPEPDRVTSVAVYRISQEALNNAFKHASATRLSYKLIPQATCLTVCIQDNGSGFDPAARLARGGGSLGIKTMRERATMLRGTCEIASTPGSGTRITVKIPYEMINPVIVTQEEVFA